MRNVIFTGVTEILISRITDALAAANVSFTNGVFVGSSLPTHDARGPRMVTFRDDSGRADGILAERCYGVNVWAETGRHAEALAHCVMAVLRGIPDGKPITAVDSFTGPVTVEGDLKDVLFVGDCPLAQMFFTFRLHVRGTHFHPPSSPF